MDFRLSLNILLILALLQGTCYSAQIPYPVIFVPGIGDSSVAWNKTGPKISKYYEHYYKYFLAGGGIGQNRFDKDFSDNIRNSCVYITFSDHFAAPDKLVPELAKVIKDTREEAWQNEKDKYFKSKDDVNVCLVTHSMGGLIARKYLTEHPKDHHVAKLIMIACPNLGSTGLLFNWGPKVLIASGIGGAIIFAKPWLLGLTVVGLGWDIISYARGVKLLSPAVRAMKPGSDFLKDLNSKPMPIDVKYVSIVSSTTRFPHVLANRILRYEEGDGAISGKSQRLTESRIPNASELDYQEIMIDSPHGQGHHNALEAVSKALGF